MEITMTFVVAAGYGIAFCVATAALISCVQWRVPGWSTDQALVPCQRQSRSVQAGLFGRKDFR
jgi:hypothetical protein